MMNAKNLLVCALIALPLTACDVASIVRTQGNVSLVPEQQLALIATPGNGDSKLTPNTTIILFIDSQAANGWKFKVAPGRHTVTVETSDVGGVYKVDRRTTFTVDAKPGMRYDILSNGMAFERARTVAADSAFLGESTTYPATLLRVVDKSINLLGPEVTPAVRTTQ
jgi:hypothetical protein